MKLNKLDLAITIGYILIIIMIVKLSYEQGHYSGMTEFCDKNDIVKAGEHFVCGIPNNNGFSLENPTWEVKSDS